MDAQFTAMMLLLVSAWLCLQQRPEKETQTEWRGASAARFAAGLLLLCAAAAELFQLPPAATLLLQQLSLYAALPLLIIVLGAQALGYQWSRMIWGRVLLALCVVFELCRRNNQLDALLITIAAAAVIALLLALWKLAKIRIWLAAQLIMACGALAWISTSQNQPEPLLFWLSMASISVMPIWAERLTDQKV
jgi:4-amino-4-deoxy-L-arabinose transferase-like glycosyltransferase